MPDVSTEQGWDPALRDRIRAWVRWYIERRRRLGFHVTAVQVEERAGIARGTLSKPQLGLGVFKRLARFMTSEEQISADMMLNEDPPKVGGPKKG